MDRYFNRLSKEEADAVIKDFEGYLIDWMNKHHIRCGSCNGYDLYRAVQNAMREEWKRNPAHDVKPPQWKFY